ncbi:FAD-dependent oxidoreductase [Pigmentibacter sp. JX0631]|uniref:FAD-dependent oxidoreductase n=1 Tax=Pigmentibacter sp. JX0631 TaxID=2976982 RepID=UPI0024682C97|nr:FAD-dependent oxidoreductase [Pigmentibacter sp. JX0631]WGL60139.1 FAD-dependent oxidoreductase [Pigmentibacter sp. JX0631]
MKIAIIGAGILGRMLTIDFSLLGHFVTLFEKDDNFSTKSSCATAAGMLTPWSEILESSELVFKLGVQSLSRWEGILKIINAEDILFNCGCSHLVAASDKAKIAYLLKYISNKDPNFIPIEMNSILLRKFFNRSKQNFQYGFYIPNEKCLDPRIFIKKSKEYFLSNKNISFHFNTQIKKENIDNNCLKILDKKYDLIINTTGFHAKENLNNLIRGVRGSLILVKATQVKIDCIVRLSHFRYPIYIVPRGNQTFIIGATSQETECLDPMTIADTLELLSMACQFDSGFLEANILEQRVNLRPTFLNSEPKIFTHENVFYINGLYRHGITISPTISKYFTEFIHHNFNLPNNLDQSIWKNLCNF